MRKFFIVCAALAAFSIASAAEAAPKILTIKVGISCQCMTVSKNGKAIYHWAVSTGKSGFETPTGSFPAQRLNRYWTSEEYNSPMPHSIFFIAATGYAIHGTSATGQLGRPASHGCVRLAPGNAAKLFAQVQRVGKARVRIVITR